MFLARRRRTPGPAHSIRRPGERGPLPIAERAANGVEEAGASLVPPNDISPTHSRRVGKGASRGARVGTRRLDRTAGQHAQNHHVSRSPGPDRHFFYRWTFAGSGPVIADLRPRRPRPGSPRTGGAGRNRRLPGMSFSSRNPHHGEAEHGDGLGRIGLAVGSVLGGDRADARHAVEGTDVDPLRRRQCSASLSTRSWRPSARASETASPRWYFGAMVGSLSSRALHSPWRASV